MKKAAPFEQQIRSFKFEHENENAQTNVTNVNVNVNVKANELSRVAHTP